MLSIVVPLEVGVRVAICKAVLVVFGPHIDPHVFLTLDSVEQSGCLLPNFLLLLSPVILLLLLELLPQPEFVLVDLDVDPFLLFFEVVDVDVDGGHAVVGLAAETALVVVVVFAVVVVSGFGG